MIYKPKQREFYMLDFQWHNQRIQRRTKATNQREALAIEARIRSELERGNYGILKPKPKPTLADFLRKEFLPFVEARCADKPNTLAYYNAGAKRLVSSDLATLKLDEITDQHVGQYTKRWECLKPTTINCGLRTLRRVLSLAHDWGKLDHKPKITLARGEHQRSRVLTDDEALRYLDSCPQPWKDVATLMLGTGMRPGECYALRWEHVFLNGSGGYIQVAQGKTKAARRLLPMVPAVYAALRGRHEGQGCPSEGWVFPTGSRSGHLEESVAKIYHAKALSALREIKRFEPYCLRHTALTNLAKVGVDAFTLARIAGHSRISTTERYIHPQAEAIDSAFSRLAGKQGLPTNSPTKPVSLPVGSLEEAVTPGE